MASPLKRLSRLMAHEVSLVKRGANRRSFLITKTADGESMSKTPVADLLALSPEHEARIDGLLEKRASRVAKADDGDDPLDERAQATLKAVYRLLVPIREQITQDDLDELVEELGLEEASGEDDDEGDDPEAAGPLDKGADADTPNLEDTPMSKTDDMKDKTEKAAGGKLAWQGEMPDADKKKHEAALKAAQDAYKACFDGKTEKDADDDDEDEEMEKSAVAKSDPYAGLPAETRAHLEMVTKSAMQTKKANAALVKKSVELEQEVAAMRDKEALSVMQAQIRDELRHLPVDVDKVSRVAKALKERDTEAFDDYMATLRQAEAHSRVRKSLGGASIYDSVGSSGGNAGAASAPSGSDAESKINALVDGYVAKSDKPLTWHQAYGKVMNTSEGIALYEQNLLEKGTR